MIVRTIADLLDRRASDLARVITTESAKTLRESIDEIAKCAACCRWMAEEGPRIFSLRRIADDAVIRPDPLGVIGAILPWNFPLWQSFRVAAPALLSGNTVVIKHSPLVPRCADAVENIFDAAGTGRGTISCRAGTAEEAQRLIACDEVRAITFTGSAQAGRVVAALAGMNLKKCVLELGGSDAFIVMPTADLDTAVRIAVASRVRGGGQTCTAAKRFIVHEAVADRFERQLVAAMERLVVGDPLDPRSDIGPLVNEASADRIEQQVAASIAAGAVVLCGGVRLSATGYAPTVLRTRTTRIAVMQEETFGPVAPVLRVATPGEAIRAANDTPFGLSASLWTADAGDIETFASELETGQLFVNAPPASRFDLPFGGVKQSGFGRTLGEAGILEFVNVKTVQRG